MTTNVKPGARVLVYWLPLGAGGHVVRWNGWLYEAIAARREHRPAADLYHCALEITVDGDSSVIEMAPVWASRAADRGVVVRGPVGLPWLGRSPRSDTRFDGGATESFPTSPKPLTAPAWPATMPHGPGGCLNSYRKHHLSPGDATNSAPVTCGTPTH